MINKYGPLGQPKVPAPKAKATSKPTPVPDADLGSTKVTVFNFGTFIIVESRFEGRGNPFGHWIVLALACPPRGLIGRSNLGNSISKGSQLMQVSSRLEPEQAPANARSKDQGPEKVAEFREAYRRGECLRRWDSPDTSRYSDGRSIGSPKRCSYAKSSGRALRSSSLS